MSGEVVSQPIVGGVVQAAPVADNQRVDAINFGPGDPAQAHAREEHVRIEALVRCYETIEAFACA